MASLSHARRSAANREIGNDHHSRRRIIVNADDLGRDERVTRNIIRCMDHGVVTSASIMPNMPYAGMALKQAKQRCDQASFGVHLTLCEGRSLTNAASLTTDNGEFYSKGGLALRVLVGLVDREELRSELWAQIALVEDHGIPVSHLDSHKHLHHLPPVARTVAELATEFGISRIRCAKGSITSIPLVSIGSCGFQLARSLFAKRARQSFNEHRLISPDHCVELSVLLSSGLKIQERLLSGNGRITELICHLGDSHKNGRTDDQMLFLLSSSFSSLLEKTDSKLATYWDI